MKMEEYTYTHLMLQDLSGVEDHWRKQASSRGFQPITRLYSYFTWAELMGETELSNGRHNIYKLYRALIDEMPDEPAVLIEMMAVIKYKSLEHRKGGDLKFAALYGNLCKSGTEEMEKILKPNELKDFYITMKKFEK